MGVFAFIIFVFRMCSDGGDVASVHIGDSCVMGADKDLDRARVLHISCVYIDNTMCCCQHMAPCYDRATAVRIRLSWRHQPHLCTEISTQDSQILQVAANLPGVIVSPI